MTKKLALIQALLYLSGAVAFAADAAPVGFAAIFAGWALAIIEIWDEQPRAARALAFALGAMLALVVSLSARATDYTVSTQNANQDAIAERARVEIWNATECSRLALATNCTLVQAQAKDANTVYANTIATFFTQVIRKYIVANKATLDANDNTTFQQAVSGANVATKNALCATVGLPNGCIP